MKKDIRGVKVRDIRIPEEFKACRPSERKLAEKRRFYEEHGRFQSLVYLDGDMVLREGYTTYVLASDMGLEEIPACFDEPGETHRKPAGHAAALAPVPVPAAIAEATHSPGGKAYSWILPERLAGKVRPGAVLAAETGHGPARVVVTAVRAEAPGEPERKKILGFWDPLYPVLRHIKKNPGKYRTLEDLLAAVREEKPGWAELVSAPEDAARARKALAWSNGRAVREGGGRDG